MPLSTTITRQGLGHSSDLETHPFSSQNQPKSNYALLGGRAGSSNQGSKDPLSNHWLQCLLYSLQSQGQLPGPTWGDSQGL